jgi:predicted CoA-substrate-specific enzyme activase
MRILEDLSEVKAGIDIGSESINLVVLRKNELVFDQTSVTEQSGYVAAKELLEAAGRSLKWPGDFHPPLISTGIGKKTISFASKNSSDIVCNARGALWQYPDARTVIDIGASGCRVMRLSAGGQVEKFAVNSKCASGTGIFLRNMTKLLECSFEEMSALSIGVSQPAEVSNYCAVFAESEVISLIHSGAAKEQIAAGIFHTIVDRIMQPVKRVGLKAPLVVTGGVAQNEGLIRALEEQSGIRPRIPPDPQIIGALGAALIGEKSGKQPS